MNNITGRRRPKLSGVLKWASSDNLFTRKEMYLATHDARGRDNALQALSRDKRERKQVDNMHLVSQLPMLPNSQLPRLAPYNGPVDLPVVRFKDRNKQPGHGRAVALFPNDHTIASSWSHLERVTREIIDYQLAFAPDYSLYLDDDRWRKQNEYNVYKSRAVAAWWQHCGLNVVPVATWGSARSFDYCFEGLPRDSVIAVCGTSHGHCAAAHELWSMALRELERRCAPTLIVVYGGKPCQIEGLSTPVTFIKDLIHKFFRHENRGD